MEDVDEEKEKEENNLKKIKEVSHFFFPQQGSVNNSQAKAIVQAINGAKHTE